MTYQEWISKQYEDGRGPCWQPSTRDAWEAATLAERERCAKLCDEIEAKAMANDKFSRSDIEFGKAAAAEACAEAIRAS